MSTQSAKKKRLGSRRRGANQNETSKNDDFHITDNTFVAECDIPEEKAESLNVFPNPDNLTTKIQHPPSPELSGNRRKLGSCRKNKLLHVEDEPIEEVEGKTRVKETTVTKQMSLAIQSEKQEVIQGSEDVSTTHEDYFYPAATPKYSSPKADLESLTPKSENLQADLEENETDSKVVYDPCKLGETAQEGIDSSDSLRNEEVKESTHLVGISELTSSSMLSGPGVDRQLIDQLNFRPMPEEKLSNVNAVTEKECKEREDNTELLRKEGNLQGNSLVSESHVESVAMQFCTKPEITTEKIVRRENTVLEQAPISSPLEELPTDEKQNELSNLFEGKCTHHSEDSVKNLHEHEVRPTEIKEMPPIDDSSESVVHDVTGNSKIISGNLTDRTEISDTYQSALIVERTDEFPMNTDISMPDDKQDEQSKKESNFEAVEQKNEGYYVSDTKKPQTSNIEGVDTALGQVYETEGRGQDYTKPSSEQTGLKEKEELVPEMERESSLQTLQTEINAPLESQPQHSNTGFNPIGNQRKLGSSRKNKGRQRVKDPVVETYHNPTEEVVGDTRDNEPLETTEMSLSIDTAVKEKSWETMLEEMDQFHTSQTEDVCDPVKENALVGGNLHSSFTVDQQMIDQSNSTEMPEEELSNVCFVKEENKEGDDHTELFRQDGSLQTHYLVSESGVKSEDVDYSITPEITTNEHPHKEHTEPHCSFEQPIFLSTKRELPTNDRQMEIFNSSEGKGAHQSEDSLNILHENEITPTDMHEIPQIYDLSESRINDATEKSELFSGYLADQTEVSDTYQFELIVKSTDYSLTKQELSNPDKHVNHPAKENYFEALEQENKDCHVYGSKKPQISDIERLDTALDRGDEIEDRVEDDIKPSAEHTGHQEKEELLSEMEESESSLRTLQSGINASFDAQPQHGETSLNSFGNRRKLGSNRKNKGRQHVKGSVAESYNVHKEDVESTKDNEAFETGQMLLAIERTSQGSERDSKPATHDRSLYTVIVPGYSSDIPGPTRTNHPEADQESLNTKSENSLYDHDERGTDFKVDVSDKSVESTLEGTDQSDTLQSQEVTGAHHSEDAVNTVHEPEVKPTEMPQIDYTSESLINDATDNSEIISGNLADQTEVSDTYQCEVIVKRTGDSPTNQKTSNSDKQDEHPTKESSFESLGRNHEDSNMYDIKEPQMSHIEGVDTALGQIYETEGRGQDDTKPSAEQTGLQEKEELVPEMERESSLQTLQTEINAPLESQPQHSNTGFNPIGNQRKLGSSRKNKGRQRVKDSVAESYHNPTEEVVGDTRDDEPLETTEMLLSIETSVKEKSLETMLEESDQFDTSQTKDVCDQVKENALVGCNLHSSLTVDQQMIDQSNSTEMPEEELSNVCFVKEENKEGDDHTELFRQDGSLQTHYLVSESCVKSEDVDYSITPEIITDEHPHKEHTEPHCSVEQPIFLSTKRELPTNDRQMEIFNSSEGKGAHQSEDSLNKLHEKEITPTDMHEIPQIDDLSESVIRDATEKSELFSGYLADQTEVSDTYKFELIVKSTDYSLTKQELSNPDKHFNHPAKKNNFEALEQENKDCHVYGSKKPQISDIERLDTALDRGDEIENRVEDDIKPSAEHTGHQEKEELLSEMEESESSLQTQQSVINASFDAQPQHRDTSLNSFGNRRKLGSNRKNKGRQHVKGSVAESYNVHKEDVESTKDNEAFEKGQMLLAIERKSQGSERDSKPATHDRSLYTVIVPGYSSDIPGPTRTNHPEADQESLNTKSENPLYDHDERGTDFKVEVSDKSVESTLEGTDQSDTLQSQEVTGAHHSEDAVNTVHEPEVKPTEMPQIDYTSESLINDATDNSEIISGNLADQTEVSDTYQCEVIVKRTGDSPTNQKTSNSDKQDEHPTKESSFESIGRNHEDSHMYDIKEPQMSHIEGVDTSQTKDVCDQVKENALVGGNLHSSLTVDQQSNSTEMPDEKLPNVCFLTETGNWKNGNLQTNYLGSEDCVKSEDIDYSITAEITTDEHHPKEHTEPHCSVEQAICSSLKEELSTSDDQKEHMNLSQIRGARPSEDAINEVHEEEVKPTEMHHIDNFSTKESQSSLQTLHSEMNVLLDSQPLDSYQSIKGQSPTDFNTKGNRRKFGSNRKNRGPQVKDTTKTSYVTEAMRQKELKEQTNLVVKPAGEIRTFGSTVNDEENTEKRSEEGTISSQNVMDSSTVVTADIPSSSGKDDFVKSKEVNETENKLIKETENLSQFTGCDAVNMELTQSPNISVWKDDSDIQNISYDENVITRPIADGLEQEGAFHVHDTEVLSCDNEFKVQQTNGTLQILGDVTIKAYNSGVESSMCVQVSRHDKDGEQKDHEAQEINIPQVITHADLFSASQNKTDTLGLFDIGLEENIQAEPAGDVSVESGTSSQQRIQEKTNLDESENLKGRSKQKRRKMGSTRQTQLNRKPEEKRGETRESDFNTEADMSNVDKMEAVEDLQIIVTAELSQNEHAKPSLSPKSKEQQEMTRSDLQIIQSNVISGIDYSNTPLAELSVLHNKEVVNPVEFVHVSNVRDSESDVEVSVESSQLDDFTTTEMHITSVLAGRNSINPMLSANTDTTNTGITGESCVSLCETTQSPQNYEKRPECVNVRNDQALKSADEPVVADLEIVKSVVRGGAEEAHMSAQASIQEPDKANEGAHNKILEMKNANFDSTNKRRKIGSTRRSLGSRTKREDLYEKEEEDNEATEAATIVEIGETERVSGNIGVLQLHKDSGSEQRKEKDFETVEHYFKPHQTFEENPVSHGQLVETEHQLTPNYLPATQSTSPKHELMSESASSRKTRKMGSHRKSHGNQNYEYQTAKRDQMTDAQIGRDLGSITDESANKTTEELWEESLGPDKISEVNTSDKKPSSNLSTSKATEQPVSEKIPKPVTPVQHPSAEIRLAQESQQKFSLAGNSRAANLQSNTYHVIMVGDSSVGKTSFMKRAQSGKFSLELPASVGLDHCMWTVVVDGKHVVLQLWDTAGQERFHSMTRQIFHKANAFLLMYDITSSQSFSAVSYWANCIQEGAAEDVTVLLVGNKSDCAERQVKTQEVEVLAKEYNFEFMECSAATGENVVQSLETVARMLSQKVNTREEAMELKKEPNKKKSSGCC